jgi:beta-galactosidase
MAGFIREYDPTRIVQYECGGPGKNVSDIRGQMYAPVRDILGMLANPADDRPVILVEYLYQIRNAGGGAYHFPALTEKYKRFQGGFVWDWQDKCLPKEISDTGKYFFAYGGDWGEDLVDWQMPPYMVANGVVLPDLTPKPCAWEIKQAQAPIIICKRDAFPDAVSGDFVVKNRYNSVCTSEVVCEAVVIANGAEKLRFPVALPIVAPNRDAAFTLDLEGVFELEGEVYISFLLATARDRPLLPKGHAIAQYQFKLKSDVPVLRTRPSMGKIVVDKEKSLLSISSAGFKVIFDMDACLIKAYEKNGIQFLSGGTENIARARSGILLEGDLWWGAAYYVWRHILPGGFTREAVSATYSTAEDYAVVRFMSKLTGKKGDILTRQTYTVYANGEINADVVMDIAGDYVHVPRVGLNFVVESGFNRLRWYGRGPGESYCDRTLASPVGIYAATVEETHFPFIPPSHNGSHADTRWLEMSDDRGNKVRITGANFSFNAHHNTIEEYWDTDHEHELIRHKEIYLTLDGLQAGIGGDMAWSSEINPKHLLPAGQYRFGFTIETLCP